MQAHIIAYEEIRQHEEFEYSKAMMNATQIKQAVG